MAELITLGLIAAQDVSFGYSTSTQTLLDQTTQTLNSINLSHLYVPYAVTFSATPVFDLLNGSVQTLTLTGNVTSSTFQNGVAVVPAGARLMLRIIQDGAGSRSFAWPANVIGGLSVTVGQVALATTIAELQYSGSNWEFVSPPLIASTLNLATGTMTGTGIANYVPKFTSASVIANSLLYDNGTQVLVAGITTDVTGANQVITLGNNSGFAAAGATTNASVLSLGIVNGSYASIASNKTGSGTYQPLAFFTNGAEQMRLTTAGQMLLGGTSTDIVTSGSQYFITISNNGGFLASGAASSASLIGVAVTNGSYVSITSGRSGGGTYLPMAFFTNGSERMRLLTAGPQLLVGGTSTDLSIGANPYIVTLGNSGGFVAATATTAASLLALTVLSGSYASIASNITTAGTYLPMAFFVNAAERMRIATNGQVLIGMTSSDRAGSPGTPYVISNVPYVVATAALNAEYVEVGNIVGQYAYISSAQTGNAIARPLVFGVAATESLRITTDPILQITRSYAGGNLSASGTVALRNNAGVLQVSQNGGAWGGFGTGTVTSVALSTSLSGVVISGSPITTAGTIILSGVLGLTSGGTNSTGYTLNGLTYYNGTALVAGANMTYDGTNLIVTGGNLQIATNNLGILFGANDSIAVAQSQTMGFYLAQTARLSLSTVNGVGDGANTCIGIYFNSAMRTVTVGVADSGGTGFRLLRIPN